MKKIILITSLAITLLSSCKDDEKDVPQSQDNVQKQAVLNNYADLVFANYSDAYDDAVALDLEIESFVANPSETGFQDVKEAWLLSRESYGQTEAFRFAGGPIDDADGPEGLLNAWPLDENHIDYVETDLNSGIINDSVTYPTLSFEVLEPLNESPGDKDISIGYHAVEFLLWGQDLTMPSTKMAGQRTFTDYTTADQATRRGEYLKVCSQGIVDLLEDMKDEWDPNRMNNYRSILLATDVDDALSTILGSIAELSESELGGERVAAAYNAADQEEEHSCFSDNTHRDIILNIKGAQNVFLGTYVGNNRTVSGPSLADLVKEADEAVYISTVKALEDAVTSCEEIPVPFDYAISSSNTSGREKVLEAFIALQEVGDALTLAGAELGYQIAFDIDTVAE